MNLRPSIVFDPNASRQPEGQDEVERAIALARTLLIRARELQTPEEARQQAELSRMLSHPEDKVTLVEMTDQAFRTEASARVADQLTHLLDIQGVPRFFSPVERAMLRGFQSFGSYLPGVAVPLVKEKMRQETANVILPAEREQLAAHLDARHAEGVRMNVNFLGEALLGEAEAEARLQRYLAALQMPAMECLSVKISTLFSQINPLARETSISVVAERLELLCRAALRHRYASPGGVSAAKFIYLDMEEYRDLYLTVELIQRMLARPDLGEARLGIALQAYVPDSYRVLLELAESARQRVAAGGTPLTIRVVKGANLEMERVEAAQMGLPAAPYETKRETDANYKRMVREILRPENRESLRLGLASHNLFDVALGLIWAHQQQALDRVQFEMLEGMANHQRRALFEIDPNLLLYAPACRKEEFLHAIGYLIRRLDENTGPHNFLRHSFQLHPDQPKWHELADSFRDAYDHIDAVSSAPRRKQDRRHPAVEPTQAKAWRDFQGEPHTDWSLPHNARWAEEILEQWKQKTGSGPIELPLFVGDKQVAPRGPFRASVDPSRPDVIVCRYQQATEEDVAAAIAIADEDPAGWRRRPPRQRQTLLHDVAVQLRRRRGDLIGAAAADGGKTVAESDPEVNEAIDFVDFYALAAAELYALPRLKCNPRGVVSVISPWNFPIAIPCGGVAAALAAGNTVLLKPASHTVLPAQILCECFWDAGVPREALQLLPCSGSGPGHLLSSDPRIATTILTGGTETAERILQGRPDIHLIAETGGKNATIVSALSDRDLAIKHVLHSAFSHSGQKCSATSLLLLEEDVYYDPRFKELLRDAAESLPVGSAWDLATRVGPLIGPPGETLRRGLQELESGESWLLRPTPDEDNPHLYSPGIKWDVTPGSFTHQTELFGPVLAVIPYKRLEQAVEIVNATGYGLTSGIETLDDREKARWRETIRAGNLYINRPTTGAIVLRQPFGGTGKSSFGPGVKAGGPNYVVPLVDFSVEEDAAEERDTVGPLDELPSAAELADREEAAMLFAEQLAGELSADEQRRLQEAIADFRRWAGDEFLAEHDHFELLGQDNIRLYRPQSHVAVRITASDSLFDAALTLAAAHLVGARPIVSFPGSQSAMAAHLHRATERWAGQIEFVEQSERGFCEAISDGHFDRIRYLGHDVSHDVANAAAERFVAIINRAALSHGRIEPLWYLQEQSISHDYHRYGNLGRRGESSLAERGMAN